jgi:hypothetical protein
MNSISKKLTLVISTLMVFVILTACNDSSASSKNSIDALVNVKFELISEDTDLNTDINYIIKMTNNSEHKIVQNNVLFSFINEPDESGETTNPFGIIAKGNKLNIEPGESVDLEFNFPSNFYEDFEEYEVRKANLYFTGYLNKLNTDSHADFITLINLKK